MSRRKVTTTIYITADQDKQLKLLSQATGMPMAELIRQGIDHVLERYKDRLPTQLGLFPGLDPAPAPSAPSAQPAAPDPVDPIRAHGPTAPATRRS